MLNDYYCRGTLTGAYLDDDQSPTLRTRTRHQGGVLRLGPDTVLIVGPAGDRVARMPIKRSRWW